MPGAAHPNGCQSRIFRPRAVPACATQDEADLHQDALQADVVAATVAGHRQSGHDGMQALEPAELMIHPLRHVVTLPALGHRQDLQNISPGLA